MMEPSLSSVPYIFRLRFLSQSHHQNRMGSCRQSSRISSFSILSWCFPWFDFKWQICRSLWKETNHYHWIIDADSCEQSFLLGQRLQTNGYCQRNLRIFLWFYSCDSDKHGSWDYANVVQGEINCILKLLRLSWQNVWSSFRLDLSWFFYFRELESNDVAKFPPKCLCLHMGNFQPPRIPKVPHRNQPIRKSLRSDELNDKKE